MAIDKFTLEDLVAEEWRDIPSYKGHYQASSIGRVRSVRSLRLMSLSNRRGYRQVGLGKDGKRASPPVHRLVMAAFHGPSELQVNHIDCNKANNRIENLEYVTHQDNAAHAVRHGLYRRGKYNSSYLHPERLPRGENNTQAKLTSEDVRNIRAKLASGVRGAVIAREFRVSAMLISRLKHGHIWKHIE